MRAVKTSRVLARLFDRSRRIDYGIAFAVAALPIGLAFVFGVAHDRTRSDGVVFDGYLGALNFTSLVVVLPALLWLMRWALGRIAPVGCPWPTKVMPPIVELVESSEGRREVYTALRNRLLSRRFLGATLAIVGLIQVADMWSLVVGNYLREDAPVAGAADWANMFLAGDGVSKAGNVVVVVSAYTVQFSIIFLGTLLGLAIALHNGFFLGRIYQRRRVPDGREHAYIHIDLADGDRCFGFRLANDAFNTQVVALALGGTGMLVSRFAHAPSWSDLANQPELILPDVGQAFLVVGWFVALAVVSVPALVKLLPRLPFGGSARASRSVTSYLREFLAPERWPFGRNPSHDEIGALAAHFASNAFWPTGNNRASQLFLFAFWIGLTVLLTPPFDNRLYFLVSLVVLAALASLSRFLLFRFLDGSLAFVDPRLVTLPADGVPPLRLPGKRLEAGVFLSYRRADSAAYTGRVYDYLVDHFQRDRIFLDIDDIPAGERFGDVLARALESCAAVLVVIGPRYLEDTGAGGSGKPGPASEAGHRRRIDDPEDWVHQEVAAALARDVRVYPVLVGGATMPSASDLPPALRELASFNACELSDKRWDFDTRRLMDDLRTALAEHERTRDEPAISIEPARPGGLHASPGGVSSESPPSGDPFADAQA